MAAGSRGAIRSCHFTIDYAVVAQTSLTAVFAFAWRRDFVDILVRGSFRRNGLDNGPWLIEAAQRAVPGVSLNRHGKELCRIASKEDDEK
jgi:hypothetical protein